MWALLESAQPDTIGCALHESDHVGSAFDAIEASQVRPQRGENRQPGLSGSGETGLLIDFGTDAPH